MLKKYFILILGLILTISACSKSQDYRRLAKKQADNSQLLYESAVQNYIKAISEKTSPNLHFELGKLYHDHGQYELAIAQLKSLDPKLSSKHLAISYYKRGDYTNALNIFERNLEESDSQTLYYFGLTCEKLNLFEKAVSIYSKISAKGGYFKDQAKKRIEAINLNENVSIADNPVIRELISSSTSLREYPDAGAVVLLADETAEILPENKVIYREHFLIKILNERGKKDFAEVAINYDSTYEIVELEYARTIKPDGTIITVGEKNIRDVSRYLDFPLYSNARVKIISMPEISDGAIIEYKAKITQNRMINDKEFNLDYIVQDTNPIKLAKFKIIAPKNKKLFMKIINAEYNKNNFQLTPRESEGNDKKIIYSWEFKNVPQIIPEVNTPPIVEITPIILISSFNSWETIYNWWKSLALSKIKSNNQIKDKVSELIKDRKTSLEKAQSVFNYCAQHIRYVAIEYGQAGHEPHDAGDIFQNKYGDCKDQAVLLVTMLRDAGLEAYPILISTRDNVSLYQDFPSALFNHSIAVVNIEGQLYFLDPTAETSSIKDLPFDDQDRYALIFKDDNFQIEKTSLSSPEVNKVVYNVQIEIDKDGKVTGKREVTAFGQFGLMQRYWLRYSPPEVIKQVLNERAQGLSTGTKLIDYSIENINSPDKPVKLIYTFSGGTIFISAGNLKMLPELAAIDLGQVAKDERFFPLSLGFPSLLEVNIKFKLDPIYNCKYLPPSLKKESKWFSFETSYDKTDKEITFHQRQKVNVKEISIDEYQKYKKFMEGLKEEINQRIILEKINEKS